MKREDDEKLWDLLGRAAEPDVFPFFARKVLRKAGPQASWVLAARRWFSLKYLIPASALATAIIAASLLSYGPGPRRQPTAYQSDPVAKIDPQDYEVVADLDELLASDESSLWDENSSL